jgi:hypothetical protein
MISAPCPTAIAAVGVAHEVATGTGVGEQPGQYVEVARGRIPDDRGGLRQPGADPLVRVREGQRLREESDARRESRNASSTIQVKPTGSPPTRAWSIQPRA